MKGPDGEYTWIEEGTQLVELLRDRLVSGAERWYELTSAIVDYPCPGVVTVEIRERRGFRREGVGVPHDVTIDVEDRMLASKTAGTRLLAALRSVLHSRP